MSQQLCSFCETAATFKIQLLEDDYKYLECQNCAAKITVYREEGITFFYLCSEKCLKDHSTWKFDLQNHIVTINDECDHCGRSVDVDCDIIVTKTSNK